MARRISGDRRPGRGAAGLAGAALLLGGLSLGLSACHRAPPAKPAPPPVRGFLDVHGAPLTRYQALWNRLARICGDAMPPSVTVAFSHRNAPSRFDPVHHGIHVSTLDPAHHAAHLVAHETTHLCLARLTHGASDTEPFRFMDEGYAEIVAARVTGKAKTFRASSLLVAAVEERTRHPGLAELEHWSSYFGGPRSGRWFTYDVGASFDDYLMDTYGRAKLRALFEDLGRTRQLDASSRKVLGVSADALERGWKAYLAKVRVGFDLAAPPAVVGLDPANGATGVPLDLTELRVRFSMPMSHRIVLVTECGAGVCYTRADWRSPTEMIVRIPDRLEAGHRYEMALGRPGNQMSSLTGRTLPVTRWSFTTRAGKPEPTPTPRQK